MSTSIGTATDYTDLLAKLDAFLCATGHAWGKAYTGTGTGDLTAYIGTASSVAEVFTITATSSTNFSVVGSVSGTLANATVGTPYTSAKIGFTITAGGTAFAIGDQFKVSTSPPWTRLRRLGCADSRFWNTNLSTPTALIDNTGTISTAATASTFIDYEMVDATPVRRIYVLATGSNAATRMPTTYVLRYKDNVGDAWTTAQTFTGAAFANGEGRILDTSSEFGARKFWRIEMTAPSATTEIQELWLLRERSASVLAQAIRPNLRAEYAWQAPGLDGTKAIVSHAVTAFDQAADIWNIGFSMSRSWLPNEGIISQPGLMSAAVNSSLPVGMLLGTTPIAYWFVVNGQRAIIVTRFTGVYQIAYLGFGLPYEPPSVHAYPAVCAAPQSGASIRYSAADMNTRNAQDPGRGNFFAYYPDSVWRMHSNKIFSTSEQAESSLTTWPGRVWPATYLEGANWPTNVRDNIDASRPLLPCVLVNYGNPNHTWGELDGVFWASGFGASSEAITRQGVFDHLLVQNITRTGVKDFGAVRLD